MRTVKYFLRVMTLVSASMFFFALSVQASGRISTIQDEVDIGGEGHGQKEIESVSETDVYGNKLETFYAHDTALQEEWDKSCGPEGSGIPDESPGSRRIGRNTEQGYFMKRYLHLKEGGERNKDNENEDASESRLAALSDYREPMEKPLTQPEVTFIKQKPDGNLPGRSGSEDDGIQGESGDGLGSKWQGWVPDSPLENLEDFESGSGKDSRGSKGDGIGGIHDQDTGPDTDKNPGIPGIPSNGGTSTTGHGFGKDHHGAPVIKHNLGGAYEETTAYEEALKTFQYAADMVRMNAAQDAEYWKEDEGSYFVTWTDNEGNLRGVWVFEDGQGKVHKQSFMPRPDGEDTAHPKQEPQLLARIAKDVKKKPSLRPDSAVSDPTPADKTKTTGEQESSSSQVASAGGTQVQAETKWKFAGRKPGSEVTDPAETQNTGSGGTPDSYRTPQGALVIDPAEPEDAVN